MKREKRDLTLKVNQTQKRRAMTKEEKKKKRMRIVTVK